MRFSTTLSSGNYCEFNQDYFRSNWAAKIQYSRMATGEATEAKCRMIPSNPCRT